MRFAGALLCRYVSQGGGGLLVFCSCLGEAMTSFKRPIVLSILGFTACFVSVWLCFCNSRKAPFSFVSERLVISSSCGRRLYRIHCASPYNRRCRCGVIGDKACSAIATGPRGLLGG